VRHCLLKHSDQPIVIATQDSSDASSARFVLAAATVIVVNVQGVSVIVSWIDATSIKHCAKQLDRQRVSVRSVSQPPLFIVIPSHVILLLQLVGSGITRCRSPKC